MWLTKGPPSSSVLTVRTPNPRSLAKARLASRETCLNIFVGCICLNSAQSATARPPGVPFPVTNEFAPEKVVCRGVMVVVMVYFIKLPRHQRYTTHDHQLQE